MLWPHILPPNIRLLNIRLFDLRFIRNEKVKKNEKEINKLYSMYIVYMQLII